MKSLIKYLLLFLNLAYLNSFSQVALKNMQLPNPDTNLLYIGYDNILKVTGVNNSLVTITSTNCEVKRINNIEFYLKSNIKGTTTINIYKEGKLLLKKDYQFKDITNPTIQVSALKSNEGTTRDIILNPNLTVVMPYFLSAYDFRVIRFSGFFLRRNGEVISTFSCETNHFSNEQLSIIGNLKPGDKILFEKIIVSGPENPSKHLQQFIFTIK